MKINELCCPKCGEKLVVGEINFLGKYTKSFTNCDVYLYRIYYYCSDCDICIIRNEWEYA